MGEQFLSFPVVASSILIFVVFLSTWNQSRRKNMPPGPWRLPVIGNMHLFLGSLPHHKVTALAKRYGPVMHLKLGEVSTIVISSPEAAKQVMKTHDIVVASRPALRAAGVLFYDYSDVIFAPYGDSWRHMRKISILELLSAKQTRSFRSIREDEASNLVRAISSSEGLPLNISRLISSFASSISSRAVSGKLQDRRSEFIPILMRMKPLLAAGLSLVDLFPSIPFLDVVIGWRARVEKVQKETDDILETIIREHREKINTIETDCKEERNNLVDVMLNLQDRRDYEYPLTMNNIKATILEMLLAGVETTSTVTDWTMSELLKNPRVMEKVQEEIRQTFIGKKSIQESDLHELKYLSLVIKETLRLHPPLPLLVPRETRDEVEINGYKIPAKTRVMVNVWTIGRDPQHWDNPELFYPERFLDREYDYIGTLFEYLPFGAGRRICPGIHFATAVIELALANMLYHFDWKLPRGLTPENLDMSEHAGLTVRRVNDLYGIPIHYKK